MLDDLSGNPIELFQPAREEYRAASNPAVSEGGAPPRRQHLFWKAAALS